MADDERGLADEIADYLLYAPVGLVLSIGEELPKLVEKGRARVEQRVTVARAVGQFAVTIGRRKAEDMWRQRNSPAAAPESAKHGPANPAPAPVPAAAAEGKSATGAKAGADAPAASTLAIPGYDSLAASQVVQRLEGLSADELDEVRRYEEATRGRRTILGRISQLAPQSEL
jgi:hypothetical protein